MKPGIYAEDKTFSAVVDRRAEILHVATGFEFTAGPVFGRTGFMLFTDLPSHRILKYSIPAWKIGPDEGKLTIFREKSNRAHGLTLDHQGRLLICENAAGRVTRREKTGEMTVLAEQSTDKRLHGPVDLVYAIDGSIYFSDSAEGAHTAQVPVASDASGRVCQITRRGDMRVVSRECGQPTGIALGPRQLELYVADSSSMTIRVFAIQADGSLSPGQIFAETKSAKPGSPVGLKTDEERNVYAAGPLAVEILDPTGKRLGSIIPPEPPSNCCWGRGFLGLYITAGASVYYVPTKIPGTRTF